MNQGPFFLTYTFLLCYTISICLSSLLSALKEQCLPILPEDKLFFLLARLSIKYDDCIICLNNNYLSRFHIIDLKTLIDRISPDTYITRNPTHAGDFLFLIPHLFPKIGFNLPYKANFPFYF